jgi:hypothetical protein
MKARLPLIALLLVSVAAVAIQTQRTRKPAPPVSLTAYIPQDALLTIESPDFAGLLHQWTSSPQSAAWLKSDNYAVFENSHLFGRLAGAQSEFAAVAGIPAGNALLNQVAGSQSVFAWYDVGSLEFLYITRMPAQQAAQTQLLQSRGSFSRRHAGNADFYVRTGGEPTRSVAFAQVPSPSGDLLVLATREDLIANALELIAGNRKSSVTEEPWFHDASAALPPEKTAPVLHMVLNLDRIVPMPSFNTYWIQQNITWMKQFRAASSDLYVEPSRFREERVLLPKSPLAEAPDNATLTQLAALVPANTGVFRAIATTDPDDAVSILNEKLLGNYKPAKTRDLYAGDPDLAAPKTGSANDLEVPIDTPPPVSATASSEALTAALKSAHLKSVLTLSSAQPADGLWVPIHSAVLLQTTAPIDPDTLAAALQQSLRGSLTAASIGIDFRPVNLSGHIIYALTGPRPLFFAPASTPDLLILTDDRSLLLTLLSQPTPAASSAAPANLIAGFDHTSQRAPYARLTSLIDHTNAAPAAGAERSPAFFSQNLRSLSDSFATLASERVVERTVDQNLRQTVTYLWQTP